MLYYVLYTKIGDIRLKYYPRRKIKPKRIVIPAALILFFTIGLYNKLEVTTYTFTSNKLPAAFDDFKIVQITDFHCKDFGTAESDLIKAIADANPDLIVLTGDMIDKKHFNLKNVIDLLTGITPLAPVYAVSGNHEYDDLEQYEQLQNVYASFGVQEVNNKIAQFSIDGDSIYLSGQEILAYGAHHSDLKESASSIDMEAFSILLYHYSNHFDTTSTWGYDLILSGHIHGGIIRLPLVGGLLGTDASFFPKYNYGRYTKNGSTMISSSGLGDSIFPRLFNHSEIVVITLKTH